MMQYHAGLSVCLWAEMERFAVFRLMANLNRMKPTKEKHTA